LIHTPTGWQGHSGSKTTDGDQQIRGPSAALPEGKIYHERHGVKLARQSLAEVEQVAFWLKPIYDQMKFRLGPTLPASR
jgi:hypothetical protein